MEKRSSELFLKKRKKRSEDPREEPITENLKKSLSIKKPKLDVTTDKPKKDATTDNPKETASGVSLAEM